MTEKFVQIISMIEGKKYTNIGKIISEDANEIKMYDCVARVNIRLQKKLIFCIKDIDERGHYKLNQVLKNQIKETTVGDKFKEELIVLNNKIVEWQTKNRNEMEAWQDKNRERIAKFAEK